MTWGHRRGQRRHFTHRHGAHHRGHKLSAAARHRISQRLRGRHHHRTAHHATRRKRTAGHHHKGHKLTAAERRKISQRERGRHHPHRGRKGVHHRHGTRRHTIHRRHTIRHLTRHRHAHGHRGMLRQHRRGTHPGPHSAPVRGRVHQRRLRRGRIYPSHFAHGHTRLHSRFHHGKRIKALRAPFVAGRRRVRAWK